MDNPLPALLRAAETALGADRPDEAMRRYRDVLALQPAHADAWYNLGYLLRGQGRFEEALDAYAQALRHGAQAPQQIHLNRAAILTDALQRPQQAEQELRLALALDPAYAPAWLNLGNLYEEGGQRQAAQEAYRQLLAGSRADKAMRLQAQTRLLLLRDAPEAAELESLQRACTGPDIAPGLRASALFALAQAQDKRGHYAQAFELAQAGNQLAQIGAPSYRPDQQETWFARIAEVCERLPAIDDDLHGPAPLFICGMFRSGSTLLEQALARHRQVLAAGELELLPRLVATRLAPFPEASHRLTATTLAALAQTYRQQSLALFAHGGEHRYLSDKRPDNFLLVGLILAMFPRARILHTVRHPLDIGLSIFMHHLNPARFHYAGRLQDIGHYIGQQQRLMAHWHARHPGRLYDFDYDAFVAEPERAMRHLLAFLELPWDPRCLSPHQAGNAVRTASYWQVREPLHRRASGRWRPYREQLRPLLAALADAGVAVSHLR